MQAVIGVLTRVDMARIIRKVRDRMNGNDGDHWAKQSYKSRINWRNEVPKDGKQCVCVNQAIVEVLHSEGFRVPDPSQLMWGSVDEQRGREAAREVQEAIIVRGFGEETCSNSIDLHYRLININDKHSIRWSDMRDGLTKAARSLH